jgi:hypothetical protein
MNLFSRTIVMVLVVLAQFRLRHVKQKQKQQCTTQLQNQLIIWKLLK